MNAFKWMLPMLVFLIAIIWPMYVYLGYAEVKIASINVPLGNIQTVNETSIFTDPVCKVHLN